MGSNCCILTHDGTTSANAAPPPVQVTRAHDPGKPSDFNRTPSSVGNFTPSDHADHQEVGMTPAAVNLPSGAADLVSEVGMQHSRSTTDAGAKSNHFPHPNECIDNNTPNESSANNTQSLASEVFKRNLPENEEVPISPQQRKATHMPPQANVTYSSSSRSDSAVAMTDVVQSGEERVRNPLVIQSNSSPQPHPTKGGANTNNSTLQGREGQSFSSHKIDDISISIPSMAAVACEAPAETNSTPSGGRREGHSIEGAATPQQQCQAAPHAIMKSPLTANFTLVTPSNSDAGNHIDISYVYSVAVAPCEDGDATPSAQPLASRPLRSNAGSVTTTSMSGFIADENGLRHPPPNIEHSPQGAGNSMQPKVHHHPKSGLVFQSFTLSPSIEERELANASTEEQLLDDVEGRQGSSVMAYHGTHGDSLRSAPSGAGASQGFQPLALRLGRSQGSTASLAANTQSSGASNASSNYFPRVDGGYIGFNRSGEPGKHGMSFQTKSSDGSTAETLKSSVSTTLHSSDNHRGSSATTTTTDSFDSPPPQQKPTTMRLVKFTEF